jgi:hypothetical protein
VGGGGLGYVEAGSYLYSAQSLNGDYRLWITGEAADAGILRVMYMNPTTGISVVLAAMNVVAGNNTVNTSFVIPPSGYYGGQVIVKPSVGITITAACLQSSAIPPVTPPVTPPIVVPVPTCGSVNFGASSPWIINTIGFYGRPPYTETAILSGTLYSDVNWAEYMAMQTYNYAIYPLVCTTISVANWQVDAYNALMAFLAQNIGAVQAPGNSCGTGLWAVLCELIRVLGNSLSQIISLLQSLIDSIVLIIQILAALIGAILALLLQLLGIVLRLISWIISMLGQLTGSITGSDATTFTPISCDGDTEAICMALAAIVSINEVGGQYIQFVVYLALGILSVLLLIWIIRQVSGIMQPGSGGE